jgi:hypothetical protein
MIGQKSLFDLRNLFSKILKLGFKANPKLALEARTVGFAGVLSHQELSARKS